MKFLSRIFVGLVIACCATNTFAAQICIMARCNDYGAENYTNYTDPYSTVRDYCSINYGSLYYGTCNTGTNNQDINRIKNAAGYYLNGNINCYGATFSSCGKFDLYYGSGIPSNQGKFLVCFIQEQTNVDNCQWHIKDGPSGSSNSGGSSCSSTYASSIKPLPQEIYLEYDDKNTLLPGEDKTIDYSFHECCSSSSCSGRDGEWTTSGGCLYGNKARVCNRDGSCTVSNNDIQGRCKAGYYGSSSIVNGTSSSVCSTLNCQSCSAGTYSSAGSTSCTNCPAGKYSGAGASSCSTCQEGYYSGEGATSCTICPTAESSHTNWPIYDINKALGGTSGTGSTSITACQLYGGNSVSRTKYYNTNGEFEITSGNCGYQQNVSDTSTIR